MKMEISYVDTTDSLIAADLEGFFVDWPNPPDPSRHLEILQASYHVWLAIDNDKPVGFINAISDGILHAYIPLLEVLPAYQGQGIGSELVLRMVESLQGIYAIDIVCDDQVAGFYQRLGFSQLVGMAKRFPAQQDGLRGIEDLG
jgi:ribosomal protein S18 acetylase RimI-like enzyme